MDPVEEFQGKEVSYVVKHAPGKEAGQVYANIQAMWLSTTPSADASKPASAEFQKQIKALEKQVGLTKAQVKGVREKYLKTDSLEVSFEEAGVYMDALREQLPQDDTSEDDDLPF